MDLIYLDNNATTKPAPEVVAAARDAAESVWANPSSVHRAGQAVRMRVELARAAVASLIGCKDREIVFTSGGTESNNLAIRGVLGWGAKSATEPMSGARGVLLTTRVEHSATRTPAEQLAAAAGVVVEYVAIDGAGRVRIDSLKELLRKHAAPGATVLVSIQWVNNETGVVQPIASIAKAVGEARHYSTIAVVPGEAATRGTHSPGHATRAKILLHVDASQAAGKLPIDLRQQPIDLLTVSAHKFHGLKGSGVLFIRTGVKLSPQIMGGPQERERRAGTENTYGILAMGAAALLAEAWLQDHGAIRLQRMLRDRLESMVTSSLSDTVIHSALDVASIPAECIDPIYSPDGRVWNTTNLGFPRLEAEAILLGLSEKGVFASAGAACSSGSLEPSPVLLAMGIEPQIAHGSVRFSLSRYTTADEIDEAAKQIEFVVRRLGRAMTVTK